MQSSERNTRSTRKFVPVRTASPGPESQSDTGQFLCIECSETFDTRLELNSHRQSHVTKKQFTCSQCGRGFHHQVFLQMHERSHEDEGSAAKSSPSRVISTRSSKMAADVVHVRPTYTKPPPCLLNSIVEFKSDPKVCQAFTPRECVTRRSHAAPSPLSHKRDDPENNLFELRISKFSDTTVHLLDAFGNSIEILADVFSTYTIGGPEGRGGNAGEASTRTDEEAPSDPMSPQRLPEVPSASSQPNDPPQSDLPPSREPVTSESLGNTDDAGLPVPALPDLDGAEPPEEEQMEDQTETASDEEPSQPSRVPQENVNHDSPIAGNLPADGEDHMATSPAAGPQGLQDEPGAPLGQPAEPTLMVSTAEEPTGSKDSQDEDSAIAALPVQLPSRSKAPSLLGDPGSVKGADPSATGNDEEHKLPDELSDMKQIQDSTLLEPNAETGRVESPKQRPGDLSSAGPGNVSAYTPPLRSQVHGQPAKEDAELCRTSSINEVCLPPETEPRDRRSTKERGAEHEEPASGEGSGRIGVHEVIPEKRDLQSVSVKEKKLQLETDICMAPQEAGDVSISEGEEIHMQVDSKEPEKHCDLLAEEDVLPDDQLAIDDKRDEDLFERDIFPLEAPMEGGEKGLASIGEEQNIVCGGAARRTKRVQEKDSDICLNGSDMTYISESEMIKLLDQDKDDITDDEPTTTSQEDLENASQQVGFGAFSESELSNNNETKSSRSPGVWNGERNTVDGTRESPAGLEGGSAEVQHYHIQLKTTDHVRITSEVHDLSDISTFQPAPEEKMDTGSCLPGSLLTIEEPRTGEPQNSMLTQDSVSKKSSKEQRGFPETSSTSKFLSIARNSDVAQPERGLQNYEPHVTSSGKQDVTPAGDSTSSRTEDSQEDVTPEEDSDVCVTVEDNDGEDNTVQKVDPLESSSLGSAIEKPHPGIPDYKGLLSATVCSTEPARATTLQCVDKLSSPQKEVRDAKPLTEQHTETKETVCNQERTSIEKKTLTSQEMENPTLDDADYMQSTSDDDDDDDQTNAASSERTDLKNEGIRNKPVSQDAAFLLKNKGKYIDDDDDAETREQTTDPSSGLDPFSKTLSTTEKDESKESHPKGTPNNKLGELPTADVDLGGLEDNSIMEDLEKPSVPSPKTIPEDLVSEVMGDDDGSATRQVSDVISAVRRPVFQETVPDSLEDSELMEDDHQEDADGTETPTKATGAGGACLKCGRKLRRSRRELVWFPVCFKCRKAAKKQERLSAHEIADGLEPLVSRREEGSSAEVSASRIEEDGDGLQQHISSKLEERDASGSAAPKMYKCPKCDKAFRIPALLAGHIKCHTLPQCLGCGCQMQLKYKTKRIPRRCQKCFQQLKEKMRAEKEVGEGSGDEESGSSDEDVADSPVDINPDDDDSSDEDSRVALQRAKRKPFKVAKPGSRGPTEQIDDDDDEVLLLSESRAGKALRDETAESFRRGEKPEIESSDELDTSDQNLGLTDGEKPRLCPQCGKAFPCNRSLNLHMLSHSGIQCESCGCRLPKRRRVGRWSRKCRGCRLQTKGKPLNDSGDEIPPSSNKTVKQKNVASVRLKAKQSKMTKNAKIQSMIKKKKELKWLNMLLAVKGLMDKSRKKKESALKAADAAKKDGESSEAEKCDSSSADNASVLPDRPDLQKAGSSKLPNKAPGATPKPGRKCLYREKNIIKVEESEVLPYIPDSAASISTAFIKKEELWQCLECNQSWPNSEALVNHQHSHISGQPLTCPQCPQVFSSEQYLNIHITAHDEERPFRCPDCDKTFNKRNHLGVHMRVHTGSRPYACPDCPCRFRQKVTLIAHRYSHRNYQLLFTKPFQCSVCSKSFKQKERLVVHERLHTGECPFSCKDCDEVFPSKARLYVHRRMHKTSEASSSSEQALSGKEVSDGQPFKCQDCGKVCSTKASFVLHRKVHRLSSIPVRSIKREQNEEVHPFSCTDCNKVFSSKATLTVHLKNHSAHKATAGSEMSLDLGEGFPCKHCDKVCITKASLARHRKVHKSPSAGEHNVGIKVESDTPSYACKDCDKVCSTKASFALHRKVHRTPMDTESPPFRCQDCDMVCSTKGSFVLHRKVHRSSSSNPQSPMGDAEPQSYTCKHCDMVCSTKSSFVLHSKVHKSPSIGEQNLKGAEEPQSYNCKHCDMVCSTKASFILHSKVHRPSAGQGLKAEEEPQLYTCKHCDVVYSTKASFALHSKVHRSIIGEQSPKTSEESQSYDCKHCDMVCSTKASFVLHSKVHRSIIGEQSPKAPEEPQSYSCKECDTVCSTKASFVLHLNSSGRSLQADPEENPFACSDCGKVCSTKASFILHRRVHKSSSSELGLAAKGDGAERPFHCKDCSKSFTSKGRLSAHRRLHDGSSSHDQNSDSDADQPKKTSEEKPFPCTVCGRKFTKLKMLVRHKAVHGERTVTPCIHCGKQFLYMKSLFNHIKICQSKGKKQLKKAAAKRKIPKDAGSTSSDGESTQKKRKTEEKQKALKLKNKNLALKAKKAAPGKEKGKGRAGSEPKTKEKRTKVDGDAGSEGEGKKAAAEKQIDGRQEKPSEQTAAKEPTPKKNLPKIKKVKKVPAKNKQPKVGGGQKKWRVLATVVKKKKKNLQAVLIGGKKKLLLKKKVPLKPKSGGKASKD